MTADAAIDVPEATVLLAARGEDQARLTAVAGRVRDAGLVAAGRPGTITYSPKVFIPVTRLCRDRCHYCTFVESPGQAARDGRFLLLSPKEFAVLEVLMRAEGTVVSAEDLLEKAWDEHADPFTNAVRVAVMTLRRKLGDPPVIETVPGAGYRFGAP